MPVSLHYEKVNHPAWDDAIGTLQRYLVKQSPENVILLGDSASRLAPHVHPTPTLLDHTTNVALYLPGNEHLVGYRDSDQLLRDIIPSRGKTILLDDFAERPDRSKSQILAAMIVRQKIKNAWVVVMVGRQLIPGVTVLYLSDELVTLMKGNRIR